MVVITVFYNIVILKKVDNLSLESKHLFLVEFFNDLNKFNMLNPQKESTKKRKTNVYDTASDLYNDLLAKYILMNLMNYQMLKQVKLSTNVILLNYFLEHIIMMSGLKMKKRLMQQEKVIKKNMQIYLTCHQ